MDLHRPGLRACFKIARRHSQIVPICPRDAAEKKQRYHGLEKISLQLLQSNRVWSRVSHRELNIQDGVPLRSSNSASARYCASKPAPFPRSVKTSLVSASAIMHSAAATVALISSQAD